MKDNRYYVGMDVHMAITVIVVLRCGKVRFRGNEYGNCSERAGQPAASLRRQPISIASKKRKEGSQLQAQREAKGITLSCAPHLDER